MTNPQRAPLNCRNGSAWHDWQTEGVDWRNKNSDDDLETAADNFANDRALPSLGRAAKRRAFVEGVNDATGGKP